MRLRGFVSNRVIARTVFPILTLVTLVSLFAAQLQPPHLAKRNLPIKVLIVGGGTSHNFIQDYKQIDANTLTSADISAHYTGKFAGVAAALAGTKVLMQASNQIPEPDRNARRGIMDFINAGGGLIALHAGTWYNWVNWPEYNRILIGGGSRSHDKFGEFEVTVVRPEHPVMTGISTHFKILDELYHQKMDPSGSQVEILATATSPITGQTYPSIWVVKGQPGRIVCLTLGHDEKAHDNPAYRRILLNTVRWTANK